MKRALVLWALLCGAAQAQIGTSLGAPMSPAIGSSFPSAIQPADDTPWWKSGPLITPDANTVAHVIWRNGALVDLKGNSWAMNGTVPQVTASGFVPPGAGPFDGTNNYTLGSGSDVLDFASGPFTFVGVGIVNTEPTVVAPFLSDGNGSTSGWRFGIRTGSRVGRVSTNGDASTANSTTIGSVLVLCGGHNAGTTYAKLNLGATATSAIGYAQDAAIPARIGYDTTSLWSFGGTILEVYVTTTAPSDAACSAIANQVASRTRRSLP